MLQHHAAAQAAWTRLHHWIYASKRVDIREAIYEIHTQFADPVADQRSTMCVPQINEPAPNPHSGYMHQLLRLHNF